LGFSSSCCKAKRRFQGGVEAITARLACQFAPHASVYWQRVQRGDVGASETIIAEHGGAEAIERRVRVWGAVEGGSRIHHESRTRLVSAASVNGRDGCALPR